MFSSVFLVALLVAFAGRTKLEDFISLFFRTNWVCVGSTVAVLVDSTGWVGSVGLVGWTGLTGSVGLVGWTGWVGSVGLVGSTGAGV